MKLSRIVLTSVSTLAVLCSFLISPNNSAFAEELLVFERTGESTKPTSTEAKKEILKNVIREVSRDQIIDLIGEEDFNKNRQLILSRVVRKSGKYLPFSKTKDFLVEGDKTEMTVVLKLSVKSLRALLLEYGLLYGSQGLPAIAHFIGISDRLSSSSFRWWEGRNITHVGKSSQLRAFALLVEESLRSQLAENGFYLMAAVEQQHQSLMPMSFQKKAWSQKDFLNLSQFFGADIVLKGDVKLVGHRDLLDQAKIQFDLVLRNRTNGRVIAQVSREFSVDDPSKLDDAELKSKVIKAGKDLSNQLLKAWQKGTFGTSVLRIVLRGKLKYPQLKEFKRGVLKKARYIKGLRERLFESGQVTYEADIDGGVDRVAQIVESTEYNGMTLKLLEVQADRAIFQAETTGTTSETSF